MDRKQFYAINSELFLCPSSYGREYADPYLGHGIGPVAGYGVRNSFDYVAYFYDFSLNGSTVKWRARRSRRAVFYLFTGENRALRYYAINNGRWKSPSRSRRVSFTYELLMLSIFNLRKLCHGES